MLQGRVVLILILTAAVKSILFKNTVKVVPKPSNTIENGIISYIGNTALESLEKGEQRWDTDSGPSFENISSSQKWWQSFKLWRQFPWKKFKGKVILNVKLGGSLSLDSALGSGGFNPANIGQAPPDPSSITSLSDLQTLLSYAAHDPRIVAIFLKLEGFQCGYAKLQEVRRSIQYFQQSGKKLIAYADVASEKEMYIALCASEFYVPPDGGVDLRGFVGSAAFVRGVFDKIGIEPQVQRIGKYKSFGDTFNRTSISDAQREVVSSLLMESSDFWVDSVASMLKKDPEDIKQLWNDSKIKTPYDFKDMGYITSVRYLDQIEKDLFDRYRQPEGNQSISILHDYSLENEFTVQPRRQLNEKVNNTEDAVKKTNKKKAPGVLAARQYLRKMRRGSVLLEGLSIVEARSGPRIAVINAVGGIQSGKSSSGGPTGQSLGSESLIQLVRRAKDDKNIKAVVLRVDSPGGSALASDLMWRELRQLSLVKPVIASMVDVAASGGYYIAMACDKIVAEELTVTGSIGVVSSKFNLEKFNEKIGYNVETISRGRYAEVLSTSRSFTEDEETYFAAAAQKAYASFTTKAALSRSMSVEKMLELAQGRVWTGKQAINRGLVDHNGGLWAALNIALNMTSINLKKRGIPVETLVETPKGFKIPFFGGQQTINNVKRENFMAPMAVCDDIVASLKLASPESLGISTDLISLGVGSTTARMLSNAQMGDIFTTLLPVLMREMF